VVIATPWSAAEAAINSLGSLNGKIVIDCMNPLGMGPDGLQLILGFNTSAGEQVASWAPGAFVFKTLNTTGAGNMAKAADYRVKPVMLVAGDDAGRKPKVMELVGKLGFEAVDAGPLRNARLLEPLAMLWIDQAMKRGRGRDFAFALVNMRSYPCDRGRGAVRIVLFLTRRLWIMGRIGIVFEHLSDDGTSDQRFQLGL
jgi:8-hydroxy-5-deazaflavin:NADPH oxidoreductase